MPYYRRPGWITHRILNPLVAGLVHAGLSPMGARILRVRGRSSGAWRETPVNLLVYQGASYLVSPRGQSQWVRNLRHAGWAELRLGGSVTEFTATEVGDLDKPPVLRAYLRRWKAEAGAFFAAVSAGATDAELLRIAPDHPVFLLTPRSSPSP
jgi:deazaflavin-dependent oxidoreductase (nitroreductase family)